MAFGLGCWQIQVYRRCVHVISVCVGVCVCVWGGGEMESPANWVMWIWKRSRLAISYLLSLVLISFFSLVPSSSSSSILSLLARLCSKSTHVQTPAAATIVRAHLHHNPAHLIHFSFSSRLPGHLNDSAPLQWSSSQTPIKNNEMASFTACYLKTITQAQTEGQPRGRQHLLSSFTS